MMMMTTSVDWSVFFSFHLARLLWQFAYCPQDELSNFQATCQQDAMQRGITDDHIVLITSHAQFHFFLAGEGSSTFLIDIDQLIDNSDKNVTFPAIPTCRGSFWAWASHPLHSATGSLDGKMRGTCESHYLHVYFKSFFGAVPPYPLGDGQLS